MIKRILSAALALVLVITAAACGGKTEPEGASGVPEETQPAAENTMPILDKGGDIIGRIDARAVCTAADSGIFYSIFALSENRFTADAEYRFFDKESGRDVLLGTLKDQGYEAVYSRTEYNGKLYTLAVTGNPMSGEPVTLVLLAADPGSGSMKEYVISKNGFPYASMAVSNGKLLVMNHEMTEPKLDKLYEFDPVSETVSEALSFSSDTDSLRGVCSAKDGFYLLRLRIGGDGNTLFLDRYDNARVKASELSVHDTLAKAVMDIPGILNRQDALNELGMNVSTFDVEDDRYLIYENFGLTRLVVDLQTGETVLAKDDICSFTVGSGLPCIYRMDFDPEDVEEPYIAGIIGGELVKLDFAPADPYRLIRMVSNSAGGTWLVEASDGSWGQDAVFGLYLWTE